MSARGEVVLIVISTGIAEGWISENIVSAVVVMVILTTLITPPMLRGLFSKSAGSEALSKLNP